MGVFKFIGDLFSKKQVRHVDVQLDPQSVQDNHVIKALALENTSLKAEKAKYEEKFSQINQEKQLQNDEETIKQNLHEQKQTLAAEKDLRIIPLKKLYSRLFRDAKFRKRMGIYTFDRSTKLADFGDIGFLENGNIALLDTNGDIVFQSRTLNDMIQSVGALGNDMARGMIPVNLDKDWGYIENIMIYEAPELIQTGDKLKFAKAKKRPVFEIIQGLNDQIAQGNAELEESEALNQELQQTIDKQNAIIKLLQNSTNVSKAELNAVQNRIQNVDQSFREVQKDLLIKENMGEIQSDTINNLENELKNVRAKALREGSTLPDERAIDLFTNIKAAIASDMPDVQTQVVQVPVAQAPQSQGGSNPTQPPK